jgi:hypothetical protein
MKTQKLMPVLLGILAAFFFLSGCSSNPTSSTISADGETFIADGPYCTVGDACDSGAACGGYDCTVNTNPPKYDNVVDDNNQSIPDYPD